MKSYRSALRRVAVAGAVAGALVAGAPAVASAETVSASYMGAAAAFSDFRWESKTRIEPLYLRVEDTKCDNMGVFAMFEVEYTGGAIWLTQARRHTGCNGYTNYNTYINDHRGISRIRLYACRDEGTNGEWCSVSSYRYNPYFDFPSVNTGLSPSLPVMVSALAIGGDGVIASGG